jgi:hypothetical protein
MRCDAGYTCRLVAAARFGSPLFLDPQCYPHCLQQRIKACFFLATRQVSGIITFRSIAFGAPNERDRQGQVGHVPKPLPGVAPS